MSNLMSYLRRRTRHQVECIGCQMASTGRVNKCRGNRQINKSPA